MSEMPAAYAYQPDSDTILSHAATNAPPPNPFKLIPERDATPPAVEPVQIGINDRWLFMLRPQEPLSVERLKQTKAELERWWASGEKFCVVGICPGVDVRLQRVDE
jgi:hypothetical protein